MVDSGWIIRAYIIGLAVLAAGLMIVFVSATSVPSGADILIATALAAFVAIAYRYPVHFDFKSSIILDTSVVFASVLLFPPGTAMLIILLGALAGKLTRSNEPEELVFNISQALIQTACAGAILLAFDWEFGAVDFNGGRTPFVLILAALAIYLTNTTLVSIVISLHTGLRPWQLWLHSTTRNDGIEQAGQFSLGILGAIVASAQPWALPLLCFPAVIIGVSLERQNHLRETTILAVQRLADLIDLRDPYTASHSRRVAGIAREIATKMDLDPEEIALIERAGQVHDIGKVVIDLGLLSKPGKLSDEEWQIFQQHPRTGVQMLELFPDFSDVVAIVRGHHERLDGAGYPDGLSGSYIPLGARILAVADAFDAMASPRPYRDALPADVVLSELERGRGTQWDAEAVDALLYLIEIGRIVMGNADERPQIIDNIGYAEELEFDAA